MPKTLITASNTPDIDGTACAIAYAYFLNKKTNTNDYIAKFEDDIHIEAKFVLKELGMSYELLDEKETFENFIMVDFSGRGGMPKNVVLENVIEVIDHRPFAEYDAFPNAKFRIELIGAAATQIAEFFYFEQQIKTTPEIAQLLLCAIYSNTINFSQNVATFRDFRMKKWLESFVADKNLYEKMFAFKTQYALEHIDEVLISDLKMEQYANIGNVCVFQIEGYDLNRIVDKKDELFAKFPSLEPADDYILILQDIAAQKTTLLLPSVRVQNFVEKSGLPGNRAGDIWSIDRIMMRKQIIPYLRK